MRTIFLSTAMLFATMLSIQSCSKEEIEKSTEHSALHQKTVSNVSPTSPSACGLQINERLKGTIPISLGKENIKKVILGNLKFIEAGKSYLKVSGNRAEETISISVYDFPKPVAAAPSVDQVLFETKSREEAIDYYLNYGYDIVFGPIGYDPCEHDCEIIVWDGVYYVVDCC